ncbi:phosphatidylglycerophosphatase A [Agrilactobacillus fermenti]|uniref:phosphatidylglycerophosphatase A family protein n=1 Tax=Agrilactobacillus fermenti TaxID=2586909 RepID=UPI003A5C519C
MAESPIDLYEHSIQLLQQENVSIKSIAELVYFLQKDYIVDLTIEECIDNVLVVLKKREVQNAIMTGVTIDELAQAKQLPEPLQKIIETDEGLYGVDEIVALSIVNVYGSIGLTNYGYIDKIKPGILAELNAHKQGEVHTFLDDIVGAIAAAAAGRMAHSHPNDEEDIY